MPDAYVIQIGGRTAGIVARDGLDLRFNFFAASHDFNALECQSFRDPSTAERAARHLAKYGSLPRRVESLTIPSKRAVRRANGAASPGSWSREDPTISHTDRSGIVSG
jgi:hypothetical protein